METHNCKLCFKIFINGRALGTHMRSHLTKGLKPSEETSSSSSDPEFPVVLQGGESDGESSENLSQRTVKRVRKFKSPACFERRSGEFSKVSESEQEPVSSSISDVTTEEDVAFCLMMMSKDEWKQRKVPDVAKSAEEEEETDVSEGKYTCETCTKTFRSYQALGGHRASHRKNQTAPPQGEAMTRAPPAPGIDTSAAMRGNSKVHECPYCFRVFGSGQALGGHKRTHAAIYGSVFINKKVRNTLIDLNLPASVEMGEYD